MKPITLLIISFAFCLGAVAQKTTASSLGVQLGTSYANVHKTEVGVNYYWAQENKNRGIILRYQIFGPFFNVTAYKLNNSFYVGQQLGLNYNQGTTVNVRICPAIENNLKDDIRIGGEIGVSSFGLFLFAGYYHPIGRNVITEITNFRFGIKFIFNQALIDLMFSKRTDS